MSVCTRRSWRPVVPIVTLATAALIPLVATL